MSAIGDDPANIAESNDAEGFVADFDAGKFTAIPTPRFDGGVSCGDVASQGHQHRDGVLGGGHTVALRAVHHDDAAAGGGIEIDVVHADAGAADHAERGGLIDHFARDAGGAADN